AGGVEDQDAIRLAQGLAHLAGQLAQQGAVVPEGLAQEVLEGVALLVKEVGDRLTVLALDVTEQAPQVGARMLGLLRARQAGQERLGKGPQTLQQAREHLRADLALRQQGFLPPGVALIHPAFLPNCTSLFPHPLLPSSLLWTQANSYSRTRTR